MGILKRIVLCIFTGIMGTSIVFSQTIKFRSISLRSFPWISMIISVENRLGEHVPVDVSGLLLFEKDQVIRDVEIIPQDSLALPIFTVIVLDKSGSMRGEPIEKSKDGAAAFVKAMREGDQAAYVEFDTEVDIMTQFTPAMDELTQMLSKTRTGSDTALLDAIYESIELHKKSPPNAVKIILVLTDGKENRSSHTLDEIIAASKEARVSIFTIGLGKQIDVDMLNKIALETEANYYQADLPTALVEIYQQISQLLHSQLVLRFKTPFPMDETWHNLKIVIPYLDREISGEKLYLSAEESNIPSDLLIQMGKQKQKETDGLRNQELNRIKEKERERIIVLVGVTFFLLAVLVLMLFLKRRR